MERDGGPTFVPVANRHGISMSTDCDTSSKITVCVFPFLEGTAKLVVKRRIQVSAPRYRHGILGTFYTSHSRYCKERDVYMEAKPR